MSNSSVDTFEAVYSPENIQDDFSFLIWRQIFKAVAEKEKQALESSKTIGFEVEVTQQVANFPHKECLVRINVICEPGKPARAISTP